MHKYSRGSRSEHPAVLCMKAPSWLRAVCVHQLCKAYHLLLHLLERQPGLYTQALQLGASDCDSRKYAVMMLQVDSPTCNEVGAHA